MDAIIGRYRVSVETSRLILKHTAGISFELTPEEAIGLGDFINVYRQTLLVLQNELERQTDPYLTSIALDNEEEKNIRQLDIRRSPQVAE